MVGTGAVPQTCEKKPRGDRRLCTSCVGTAGRVLAALGVFPEPRPVAAVGVPIPPGVPHGSHPTSSRSAWEYSSLNFVTVTGANAPGAPRPAAQACRAKGPPRACAATPPVVEGLSAPATQRCAAGDPGRPASTPAAATP